MAKRAQALQRKEDIEAVPVDQPVDIDVGDDQIVTIVQDGDGQNNQQKQEPSAPPQNNRQAAPETDDTVDLLKQVEALKQAEETQRAQIEQYKREAEASAARARELEAQNTRHQAGQLEAEYDSVVNAIAAVTKESEAAARDIENAALNGDFKLQAEAQRRLARAEARLESLEQGKISLEPQIDSIRRDSTRQDRQATHQQTAPDPFEQAISALPDSAKSWLRNHREYMTEPRKNAKIQAAHWDVLDAGHQAYSPSYYEELEVKLGIRQKPETNETTRGQTVSAPVSRESISTSTGAALGNKRVTLTPEQREVARASMPHLAPGEAERIYAQNLLKLNGLKREGHYTER